MGIIESKMFKELLGKKSGIIYIFKEIGFYKVIIEQIINLNLKKAKELHLALQSKRIWIYEKIIWLIPKGKLSSVIYN